MRPPPPELKTRFIKARAEKLDKRGLHFCLESLETGGLLVFPTDTVYGLGCNAFNVDGVHRIFKLKGRHYNKPLPVLLGSVDHLELVAREIPREAWKLIRIFWPGPLTLVFKTAPMALHASRGKPTVAVRVPDHGVVRQILRATRLPMAATSANVSGRKAITSGREAGKTFGSRVDVVVDGGRCRWERESSVVDATHYPFTILREGALSKKKILAALDLA